ncbi:MAG TPA: hypothetical protein VHR66_07565 [Gemmataceae bacterium]|jgi:hypothetical protein|nr:hypothetical protein [Gemmataceae bacterium]
MDRLITREELHRLLKAAGHAFWSAEPTEEPIDVSPPAETYLTVGLDSDGTLKPAYRDRCFACRRDSNDDPVISHAEAFAFGGAMAAAAARDPRNNEFVLGPFRWLLARVRRFEQLLLWPKESPAVELTLDRRLLSAIPSGSIKPDSVAFGEKSLYFNIPSSNSKPRSIAELN